MMLSRRQMMLASVLGLGGLHWPAGLGRAVSATLDIWMQGTPNGSAVWFDPVGLLVEIGQTVRWINDDRGNSHTATTYHPANGERPLRIPVHAEPWDSGYLMPGESFSVTLSQEGVYDYLCLPHEMAGMVGRLVVGSPDRTVNEADDGGAVPEVARRAFPSVQDILRHGAVRVDR